MLLTVNELEESCFIKLIAYSKNIYIYSYSSQIPWGRGSSQPPECFSVSQDLIRCWVFQPCFCSCCSTISLIPVLLLLVQCQNGQCWCAALWTQPLAMLLCFSSLCCVWPAGSSISLPSASPWCCTAALWGLYCTWLLAPVLAFIPVISNCDWYLLSNVPLALHLFVFILLPRNWKHLPGGGWESRYSIVQLRGPESFMRKDVHVLQIIKTITIFCLNFGTLIEGTFDIAKMEEQLQRK